MSKEEKSLELPQYAEAKPKVFSFTFLHFIFHFYILYIFILCFFLFVFFFLVFEDLSSLFHN